VTTEEPQNLQNEEQCSLLSETPLLPPQAELVPTKSPSLPLSSSGFHNHNVRPIDQINSMAESEIMAILDQQCDDIMQMLFIQSIARHHPLANVPLSIKTAVSSDCNDINHNIRPKDQITSKGESTAVGSLNQDHDDQIPVLSGPPLMFTNTRPIQSIARPHPLANVPLSIKPAVSSDCNDIELPSLEDLESVQKAIGAARVGRFSETEAPTVPYELLYLNAIVQHSKLSQCNQRILSEHVSLFLEFLDLADPRGPQKPTRQYMSVFRKLVAICDEVLGTTHSMVISLLCGFADTLSNRGDDKEAEYLFKSALDRLENNCFSNAAVKLHSQLFYSLFLLAGRNKTGFNESVVVLNSAICEYLEAGSIPLTETDLLLPRRHSMHLNRSSLTVKRSHLNLMITQVQLMISGLRPNRQLGERMETSLMVLLGIARTAEALSSLEQYHAADSIFSAVIARLEQYDNSEYGYRKVEVFLMYSMHHQALALWEDCVAAVLDAYWSLLDGLNSRAFEEGLVEKLQLRWAVVKAELKKASGLSELPSQSKLGMSWARRIPDIEEFDERLDFWKATLNPDLGKGGNIVGNQFNENGSIKYGMTYTESGLTGLSILGFKFS
jgi:tetratricopeptide (TPR) repeat protein